MVAFACLGVIGIIFSYLAHSDAIMLDGVYSFVLCVVSAMGMQVARLVQRGTTETHPFGYFAYEPTLNTIKGIIVLAVVVMALISAIEALFQGGREMGFGIGLVYSVIVTTTCVLLVLRLRREAAQAQSPLLVVEARNWTVDAIISGGIGVAFLLGFLVDRYVSGTLAAYVDPALTVVVALSVAPIPLRTVREGLSELLVRAPPRAQVEAMEGKIRQCLQDYPAEDFQLRLIKVGRSVYALVHIIVSNDTPTLDIAADDALRVRLHESIVGDDPFTWVDLVVTRDRRWAPGIGQG